MLILTMNHSNDLLRSDTNGDRLSQHPGFYIPFFCFGLIEGMCGVLMRVMNGC